MEGETRIQHLQQILPTHINYLKVISEQHMSDDCLHGVHGEVHAGAHPRSNAKRTERKFVRLQRRLTA